MKILNRDIYLYVRLCGTILDTINGEILRKLNKYTKIKNGINTTIPRQTKIILSLKTYNKRYEHLGEVIKSLLVQSVKPDKFIIWLDSEKKDNILPLNLIDLKKYGVEFRYTEDDLKSHAKYFYSLQEYRNDIVITVDDDVIYPSNLISSLLKSYRKYPTSVSARRVHLITLDDHGNIEPYDRWKQEYRLMTKPSYRLCAIGVGGVLYPPNSLPENTYNRDMIKKYCWNADDIWLKFMELINETKVVWVPNGLVHPPRLYLNQNEGLNFTNVIEKKNDLCITSLGKMFPVALEKLLR